MARCYLHASAGVAVISWSQELAVRVCVGGVASKKSRTSKKKRENNLAYNTHCFPFM